MKSSRLLSGALTSYLLRLWIRRNSHDYLDCYFLKPISPFHTVKLVENEMMMMAVQQSRHEDSLKGGTLNSNRLGSLTFRPHR